jgi:hypothetical protein
LTASSEKSVYYLGIAGDESKGRSATNGKNKSKIETVCHEDNANNAAHKFGRAIIPRWEVLEVATNGRDVRDIEILVRHHRLGSLF